MLYESSKGARGMPKYRGGVGKRTKKSAKKLVAVAETLGEVVPRLSVQLAREKPTTISVEKLRSLRHFRPSYIKTLLSKLLLVGEGRSRLSFTTPGEERLSR